MGDHTVKESRETIDLLTLVGRAIEQLQRSIESFETADRNAGLQHLSTVIRDIDAYLEQLAEDPLVRLARVDSDRLTDSLHHVQNDLSTVIDQVVEPPIP